MEHSVGLLGAGGQASEVEDYLHIGAVLFRAVNLPAGEAAPNGVIDILTTDAAFTGVPVTAAVGAPGLRRHLVRQWGGERFHSVLAPGSVVARSAVVGAGAIVAPGAVVTAGAMIGDHALVNVSASVSHSSAVGAYATLSPGVRVAGDCFVGDGVFLGIGAVLSHGIRVCDGAVVGAGALVLEDISEPGVYVGSPARFVRSIGEWLWNV